MIAKDLWVDSSYGEFCVPANDTVIGRSLLLYGEWATIELSHLARFIPAGGTVLDIGACYGTHTLSFAEIVGPTGRVFAFEASDVNFQYLERNINRNDRHNIIEVRKGVVGNCADEKYLVFNNRENYGSTSVRELSSGRTAGGTVALCVDEIKFDRVDLIKIDVEGMEAEVIAGARNILASKRPIVFFEVNSIDSATEVLKAFVDLKYQFYGDVTFAYNPHNYKRNTENVFGNAQECGIFAIPSEEKERLSDVISELRLLPIERVDDLLLLLLNKPQYFGEILIQKYNESKFFYQSRGVNVIEGEGPQGLRLALIADQLSGNLDVSRDVIFERHSLKHEAEALRQLVDAEKVHVSELKNLLAIRESELKINSENFDLAKNALADLQIEYNYILNARRSWELEISRINRENESLRQRMRTYNHEYGRILSELCSQSDGEIRRLNEIVIDSQKLAVRARKFPFSLYFRTKKKYRRITKEILRAALGANGCGKLQMPDESTVSSDVKSEKHPLGYRAEVLSRLTFKKEADVKYSPEPQKILVGVDAIESMCKSASGLLISFSHDNYLVSAGGTQLCIGIEQSEAQAGGFDYLHVFPLQYIPALAPEMDYVTPSLGVSLNGTSLGVTSFSVLIEVARRRATIGRNTRVIVHHLLSNVPEAVVRLVEATGQNNCIVWLHDLFSLCVNPFLLRNNVSFCGAPGPASGSCQICAYGEARTMHLRRFRRFFESLKVQFVAPSEFVAQLFSKAAGVPFSEIVILPHLELSFLPENSDVYRSAGPVRVAFVGMPADHKGWQNFLAAASRFGSTSEYEFLYFGSHSVEPEIRSFQVTTSAHDRLAMVSALRAEMVDVVVHISPTPETFSFTTHEALAAGAVVVTNRNAGNTALVVERFQRGLVLEEEGDLIAAFESGEILQLAQDNREKRSREKGQVRFGRMSLSIIAPQERI